MILFCEDCGGKNFIYIDTISSDIVEFRCQECNYLNRVPRLEPRPDTEQTAAPGNEEDSAVSPKIEEILEKLNLIHKVTGSFIFHNKKGVTAKKVPDALDEKKLAAIGSILEKNYCLGQSNFRDIASISMVLKKSVLVLKKVTRDVFLILVCTPAPATDRLEESLNSAVDELKACSLLIQADFTQH